MGPLLIRPTLHFAGRVKICANCSEIKHEVAVKQELLESGAPASAGGEPGVVGVNHLLELAYDDWDELYKNRSSRKMDSRRLFSRENDFPKIFSLTENLFSGKTYFYTIAPRPPTAAEKENGFDSDSEYDIKREGRGRGKAKKRKRGRPRKGEERDSSTSSKAKKPRKSREEIQ